MAANDVETYLTTPDKVDSVLTTASVLVGDNISITTLGSNQVFVVVVKSA